MNLEGLIRSKLENVRPVAGGGWQCACPICRLEGGDSQRNHLRVYLTGAFSCAKLQGDATHNKLIRAYLYKDASPEALALLETSFVDPDPKIDADKIYPEEMLKELVPDHSYWVNRGISEDVLRRLEGGYVPKDRKGKLSNRYVFPIRDHITGRIVGFSGRLVDPNSFGPKYKHLVKSSRVVYPLWYVKKDILAARKVVLVESSGDCLSLLSYGINNVLVLLGLNLNSKMMGFLASASLDEVIISTNNDNHESGKVSSKGAGNVGAQKIYDKLVPYLGEHRVRIRLPMTGKDWNEADVAEIQEFKKELESKPVEVTV